MAKPYSMLRDKMGPERRAKVDAEVREAIKNMPLDELRAARAFTQTQLATELDINQAGVSKLERRADMYVSTLRRFVEAMGGQLEIRARFPEGDVRITQFADTREVGRFWTVGASGRYLLIETARLIDVRTHRDPTAAPREGVRSLRTSEGLAVSGLPDGTYQIVQTGEILSAE